MSTMLALIAMLACTMPSAADVRPRNSVNKQQTSQGKVADQTRHHTQVTTAFRRESLWQAALMQMSRARDDAAQVDVVFASIVLDSAAKAGLWQQAKALLVEMVSTDVEPSVVTYGSLVRAFADTLWHQAFSVFSNMASKSIRTSTITSNSVTSASEKGKQWLCALAVLKATIAVHMRPDLVMYNAATSACEKGVRWPCALDVLFGAQAQSVRLDVVTHSSGISACEKGRQWERALCMLRSMICKRTWPNTVTYDSIITACARCGQDRRAAGLFDDIKGRELEASIVSYVATVDACAMGSQWASAIDYLVRASCSGLDHGPRLRGAVAAAIGRGHFWQRALNALRSDIRFIESGMRLSSSQGIANTDASTSVCAAVEEVFGAAADGDIEPCLRWFCSIGNGQLWARTQTFRAAVGACKRLLHMWPVALALVERMQHLALESDLRIRSAASSACASSQQWACALAIVTSAIDNSCGDVERSNPQLVAFNVATAAMEKGSLWQDAIRRLRSSQDMLIKTDAYTFGTAIGTCDRALEWGRASWLFRLMLSATLETDLIPFNSAMSAYDKGEQWQLAFVHLRLAQSWSMQLGSVAVTLATAACGRGRQWQLASRLFQSAVDNGGRPTVFAASGAIAAFSKGTQWRKASIVLHQMRGLALEPDAATRTTETSAHEKGCVWQCAYSSFADSRGGRAEPGAMGATSLISAAGFHCGWALAVLTLVQLEELGGVEDPQAANDKGLCWRVPTCSAAVLACVRDDVSWRYAFFLLDGMKARHLEPDRMTQSRLLMECEQRGLLLQAVHRSRDFVARRDPLLAVAMQNIASLRIAPLDSEADGIAVASMWAARLRSTSGGWDAKMLRQRGGRGQYTKEICLLWHVVHTADHGNPQSVCEAMESYGGDVLAESPAWLKIAGGAKTDVLLAAVRSAPPRGHVLEIGTYCGYSCSRLATIASPANVRVVSLELDPVHVVIARNVVALAGFAHAVDIWTGHSADVLPRLVSSMPAGKSPWLSAVFMDQRGSRYSDDLAVLEGLSAPRPRMKGDAAVCDDLHNPSGTILCDGAVVVADNVLKPGAPVFLWRIFSQSATYYGQAVTVCEFAMRAEDWMSVSIHPRLQRQRERQRPEPAEVAALEQMANGMREKAVNVAHSVPFTEWADFAARMRSGLNRATGIAATASATKR